MHPQLGGHPGVHPKLSVHMIFLSGLGMPQDSPGGTGKY